MLKYLMHVNNVERVVCEIEAVYISYVEVYVGDPFIARRNAQRAPRDTIRDIDKMDLDASPAPDLIYAAFLERDSTLIISCMKTRMI